MAKILIVDDQPEVCDVMQRLFKAMGWHSDCLTNPQAVHDKVRADRPDVVLLDVMMPELDGFEVVRRMRGEGTRVPTTTSSKEHPSSRSATE